MIRDTEHIFLPLYSNCHFIHRQFASLILDTLDLGYQQYLPQEKNS
jgi:hypothetical protein